jgi:ParB-like chromosome segregation protein Spo0J
MAAKETNQKATADVAAKLETRKIAHLNPHPQQEKVFGTPPEHEIKELAENLKARKQRDPIHILPDGTVLAGHKRILAFQHLGWAEIECWVHYELADDPAGAERLFVEDNLIRRQLSDLARARAYKRLKELGMPSWQKQLSESQKSDLRDQIAAGCGGISGRTLDRLLRIAEHTPQEVQDAFDAGTLPMTKAYDVAGLGEEQRQEIAEKIRVGGDPREVVGEYLKANPRRSRTADDAKNQLVRALARADRDLGDRVEEVSWLGSGAEDFFDQAVELIGRLKARAKEIRVRRAAADRMSGAEAVGEDERPE